MVGSLPALWEQVQERIDEEAIEEIPQRREYGVERAGLPQ